MQAAWPGEALVVGAGVIGLSSAVRLAEAGCAVRIVARARTPHTTSDVAAAVFFPYRAEPWGRVRGWGRDSYAAFAALAQGPSSGVSFVDLVELHAQPAGAPWRQDVVPAGVRRARPDELPPGYVDGFVAPVPVMEMPVYLRWLEARVDALGILIGEAEVHDLAAVAKESSLVVHCTGLGARELGDASMFPIRGQVVRVRNPGLRRARFDEHGPLALAYAIPRGDEVVLGGTAQVGDWDLNPDPATEELLLAKGRGLEPVLAACEVTGRAVGLRPGRPSVRLEAEQMGTSLVIHNYGHGGSGVTLSWGCADEVVRLARANVAAIRGA